MPESKGICVDVVVRFDRISLINSQESSTTKWFKSLLFSFNKNSTNKNFIRKWEVMMIKVQSETTTTFLLIKPTAKKQC